MPKVVDPYGRLKEVADIRYNRGAGYETIPWYSVVAKLTGPPNTPKSRPFQKYPRLWFSLLYGDFCKCLIVFGLPAEAVMVSDSGLSVPNSNNSEFGNV